MNYTYQDSYIGSEAEVKMIGNWLAAALVLLAAAVMGYYLLVAKPAEKSVNYTIEQSANQTNQTLLQQ